MNLNAPESLPELPTQFSLGGRRYVLRAMPQPSVATRAVGVFDVDSTQTAQPPVFVKWATGTIDLALLRWEWSVLVERLPCGAPVLSPLGWVEAGPYSGLVLPFQDGPTIERALRSRALGLGEIMGLTAALCEAVEPLAAQGWQHHDLKPENLLITPEGLVLVDLESASSALEGPPGGPRTSPRYQPPEREFSLTRDVYSIGVMLMDLLALRLGRSFAITSLGLWEALDMAMATHTSSDGATLDLLARALDRDPNRRPTCRALGEAAASLRDALNGPQGAALMERLAPDLAAKLSERPPETNPEPPLTLWTQNPLLIDLPGARGLTTLKAAETVLIPLLPLAALLGFCVLSVAFGGEVGDTERQSLYTLVGLSLAVPLICNAVQRAKEASQSGEEGGWLASMGDQSVWRKLAERTWPDRFIAVAIGLCFGLATASATTESAAPAPFLQWTLLAWGQALVSWLCLKPLRVLALINETFASAPDRWFWADERRRRLVTVFVRRLLASIVLAQAATLVWALVNLWPLHNGTLGAAARLVMLLWGGFVLSIGLGPLLFTMAGFRLYLHRLEDELHNPGPSTARFNFVSRKEWWTLAMAQAAVVVMVAWGITPTSVVRPDPCICVDSLSSADARTNAGAAISIETHPTLVSTQLPTPNLPVAQGLSDSQDGGLDRAAFLDQCEVVNGVTSSTTPKPAPSGQVIPASPAVHRATPTPRPPLPPPPVLAAPPTTIVEPCKTSARRGLRGRSDDKECGRPDKKREEREERASSLRPRRPDKR